jgi:hypothetical protein
VHFDPSLSRLRQMCCATGLLHGRKNELVG